VVKEDLAGLQELSARYPWFGAAHLLLAVGEHAADDVLFDERARTAAAHVPSRAVLFDLVHAPTPTAEPAWVPVPTITPTAPPVPVAEPVALALVVPAPIVTEVPASTPAEHLIPPAPAAPVVALAPEHSAVEEPVPHAPVEVVGPVELTPPAIPEVPPVTADPLPAVAASAAEPPSAEGPARPEADPLDQLIRESAYVGTYELLLEHEEARRTPPPAPEPAPMPERPAKRRFTDWLEPVEPFSVVPVAPSGPAHSDWLRHTAEATGTPGAATPPAAAPGEGKALARPASTSGEGQAPAAPVEASGEGQAPAAPAKPKGGMSVSEAASLIDSFIRQETPDPPKRAAFFNPQTAAKRSLEEHAELVTETLAQIYAKQGNTAKAKAAYRRLAEKHPERREHFLALAKGLDAPGKA
jgi:hypothetical protein